MPKSYEGAGVSVEAGYKAVDLIKQLAEKTFDKNVISPIGSFGGFYALGGSYKNPVLVSGADGVGTKLRIAMMMDKHDTIGIDCVAMCVNDIVCHGAKPLFFLDYLASGKTIPVKTAEIVKGIAEGCKSAGCALIGGETAEMPGFYADDDYDIAGFVVGIIDREKLIDGSNIKSGDVLIGLASSGVHSNGYSLVRKIFNQKDLGEYVPELKSTIGEALLEPTKIYVKTILSLIDKVEIKGVAHITGGGFIENIPRIVPDGLCAKVDLSSFDEPYIFTLLRERGGLDKAEMYNIFNMGLGMVLAVSKDTADAALKIAGQAGEKAYIIGEATEDENKVKLV